MDVGPLKLIKSGFWLGLGFIVPIIIGLIVGTFLLFSFPSLWQPGSEEMASHALAEMDKTAQVRITDSRKTMNGTQTLILGTVENTGPDTIGSVQLEAEFFDGSKKMVFECSEYISQKLAPSATENFQIKCGCTSQTVPAHESFTVRVISASSM